MLKIIFMSSGIYLTQGGAVLMHYPLSTPLLHANRCQTERDAAELVQLYTINTAPHDVPSLLQRHALAMTPPYDWCIPRYRTRPSLTADNPHHFYWPPEPGSPMMIAVPRPPKRPRSLSNITLTGKPDV
jgi:hypothetical protein